jgi:predicted Fe-Mo cluster-binding NifX family protein
MEKQIEALAARMGPQAAMDLCVQGIDALKAVDEDAAEAVTKDAAKQAHNPSANDWCKTRGRRIAREVRDGKRTPETKGKKK